AAYEQGNRNNAEPERRRRLLLHKREIEYLDGRVRTQGLTIVPLRLYLARNRVKVEIGLARGKKLWDKRQDVAKRDAEREMERAGSATCCRHGCQRPSPRCGYASRSPCSSSRCRTLTTPARTSPTRSGDLGWSPCSWCSHGRLALSEGGCSMRPS